jgi:hypothetical protein
MGLSLLTASSHDGVNPFAAYYRDVTLTSEGEELRRDLARWRLARVWTWIEVSGRGAWIPILIVASAGLYYNCSGDRPLVQTTQIQISGPGADQSSWLHSITNSGKEEARAITLKLGTIERSTKKTVVLQTHQWVKLGAGLATSVSLPFHKKDFLGFFVTCLTYRGQPTRENEPSFYQLLDPLSTMSNTVVQPTPATPSDHEALSAGFSCARL